MPEEMEFEARISGLHPSAVDGEHPGDLSGFTCPECPGPLYEIREGKLVRYRCRVGHAYTADGALEGKEEAMEDALYAALNTPEESADTAGQPAVRSRGDDRPQAARERAETIRRVLMTEQPSGEG